MLADQLNAINGDADALTLPVWCLRGRLRVRLTVANTVRARVRVGKGQTFE